MLLLVMLLLVVKLLLPICLLVGVLVLLQVVDLDCEGGVVEIEQARSLQACATPPHPHPILKPGIETDGGEAKSNINGSGDDAS